MLKVGFVGLGAISHESILGYLESEDAKIMAVCDVAEHIARTWLEKWDLRQARYYDNLETMLAVEDLDIVEILTPHHLHAAQVMKCAAANVQGISLQKPMGVNLRECDQIIASCQKNRVKLKVYENFIFYPVYQKAKELINQGLLGDLSSIRVNTMTGLKAGAPWPWCFSPTSWRLDLGKSGVGPLVGDDGYHKFSLARWFMNRDFEKVGAWIDRETPLDAPAFIRARFRRLPGDSPKYAQLDFTYSARMALPSDFWLDDFVEIVGDKGVMWINQCSAAGNRALFTGCEMSKSPVFPPIAVFVDGQVTTYLDNISPDERNWSTSFVRSTKHFIEVIKNGGQPIQTGEEGKEITRSIMAAYISAQEKRDVYLDEITTEAEANRSFELRTNFCNVSKM